VIFFWLFTRLVIPLWYTFEKRDTFFIRLWSFSI